MVMGNYAQAIQSLWSGKCTVTVRNHGTTDENTGRAVVGEVDTYTDEPCRISFDTVTTPDRAAHYAVYRSGCGYTARIQNHRNTERCNGCV